MAITTAGAIIRKSLGNLSIVTPARKVRADELAVGLESLNDLLDETRLPPFFATSKTETVVTLPPNTPYLTIGLGQQINIARPVRIEYGSFTRQAALDYPLAVWSQAQYAAISQKTLSQSWPAGCFFDGGNPIGRVYFWPLSNIELHLFTLTQPGYFANVTTEYDLTPGMTNFCIYTLACELSNVMGVAVPARVVARAQSLRRQIISSNLTVPQLDVGISRSDPQADFLRG